MIMITAIVPVKNEMHHVSKVLTSLRHVPVDSIIPVINGTTDASIKSINEFKDIPVYPVYFSKPLGIDIPRAAGARVALQLNASVSVFVDGDMSGDIGKNILQLVNSIKIEGLDLSLTNCYPDIKTRNISPLAMYILQVREELNQNLHLAYIGTASPSHGPHAISRRFLEMVSLEFLAIPPTLLAFAAKNKLKVGIGTAIPHSALGSPLRDQKHSNLIAETIIGDCAEALQLFKEKPRHRYWGQKKYTGYHCFRRWDLLKQFLYG